MEFTFKDFQKRALEKGLTKIEKIGFPESYRKDSENIILEDISNKLLLQREALEILDIGCGCSGLTDLLVAQSEKNLSRITLIDSEEMLSNLQDYKNDSVVKIPGYFPEIDELKDLSQKYDAILVYSVLQYVFIEQNVFSFIHRCIDLLKPGGRLLIGDIPNFEARKRFLSSEEGRLFAGNKVELGGVDIKHEDRERIDDSVVISILSRFRKFECETYLMPQNKNLPFGNRREDILIVKR